MYSQSPLFRYSQPTSSGNTLDDSSNKSSYAALGTVRITAKAPSTEIVRLVYNDRNNTTPGAYPAAGADGAFDIDESQVLLRPRRAIVDSPSAPQVLGSLNGQGANFFNAKFSDGEVIPDRLAADLLQECFSVAGVSMAAMRQAAMVRPNSGVPLAITGLFNVSNDVPVAVGDTLRIEFPVPGETQTAQAKGSASFHRVLPRIVVSTPESMAQSYRDLLEAYARDPQAISRLMTEAGRPLQTRLQNSVHTFYQSQISNALTSVWWLIREGFIQPTPAFIERIKDEQLLAASDWTFESVNDADVQDKTRGPLGWGLNAANAKHAKQAAFDKDAWATAVALSRVLLATNTGAGQNPAATRAQRNNLVTRINLINALNPSKTENNAFYQFGFSFSKAHRASDLRSPNNPAAIVKSKPAGALLSQQLNAVSGLIGSCLSAFLHYSSSNIGVAYSNARAGGKVDVFVDVTNKN